jgi:hypothetical protein
MHFSAEFINTIADGDEIYNRCQEADGYVDMGWSYLRFLHRWLVKQLSMDPGKAGPNLYQWIFLFKQDHKKYNSMLLWSYLFSVA